MPKNYFYPGHFFPYKKQPKAVSYRREKTLDLELELGVKLVRLRIPLWSPYTGRFL